jgi:hypothetical protein
MSTHIPLEAVRVATPCNADWNRMTGDERTRFCQSCTKNVYNLSGMTRTDAENLIREKEGNLCVRFYRRADGTILTDDCPVALKAMRRPVRWTASLLTMVFAPAFAFAAVLTAGKVNATMFKDGLRSVPLFVTVAGWFDPQGQTIAMGAPAIAGGMTVAPPVATPTPPTLGEITEPIMGEPVIVESIEPLNTKKCE